MTLKDLKSGQTAVVSSVGGQGALRQHFLDMGIIPGAKVQFIKTAPMGDPMEFRLNGYELTLRSSDAGKIKISELEDAGSVPGNAAVEERPPRLANFHPGLGEDGIHHNKKDEHPLPAGTVLSFALVGNKNCGKTALFNKITGENLHVGNFPGVTVERQDGTIPDYPNTLITDLPGIYSLSPFGNEGLVTRDFILKRRPEGIINIIDASNIERNLYLTLQLLELDIPMVVALNMMDEVAASGGTIRVNEMENLLGVPVIPISAAKGEGIGELVEHAVHVAQYGEKPERNDFCGSEEHGGAVHRCIHAIMHLVEDHASRAGIPCRFASTKLVEGDRAILDSLDLDDNEKEMLEHLVSQMESERGLDRNAAIAEMRYDFISRLCAATVIKPTESRQQMLSRRIDRVLTGRYTALPALLLIVFTVFYLTFGSLGGTLARVLGDFIEWSVAEADALLINYGLNPVVKSLVTDGIITGVGTVLSFLPFIIILFFCLSMMEDSGYMSRIAFVMDSLLRKIGLSGGSIIPMLVGFGCTVPAVMAARTLPSVRDRKLTILMMPFMSCSAKLPVYTLLIAAFFPRKEVLILPALYVFGVLAGILVAFIFRKTIFKGEPVPFVMELPPYRMPSMKNVFRLLWEKGRDFVTKAFTVIFVASIAIWFLQTFDFRINVVSDPENSMLAVLSGFIAPVFTPLGFGNWQVSTALMTGFVTKENVVSTLSVLLGQGPSALSGFLAPAAAISLLVFILLYTPCVASISVVRQELGSKWAVGMVVLQCLVAYIAAYVVHSVAVLLI